MTRLNFVFVEAADVFFYDESFPEKVSESEEYEKLNDEVLRR